MDARYNFWFKHVLVNAEVNIIVILQNKPYCKMRLNVHICTIPVF